MLLLWREEAEADLDAIVEYLLDRSPAAAVQVQNSILEQSARLADHPDLGRRGRVAGTRELVIARTPYILAYTVDHDAKLIVVLRIIHGARRWPVQL